jgi:1-acyl-sn-glycerol-3-phosphate acyltransferase
MVERSDLSQRLASADLIAGTLSAGLSVLVFPEGTFFRPPGILPFRLGAFRAAVDAGRPVLPIALRGTRRLFPDGARLLRPTRLEVTIGAPLVAADRGWPEMVRLRNEARAQIARSVDEPVVDESIAATLR